MHKSALYAFGLVVMIIVALGLITLSTASEANSVRLHHGDAYFFFIRQCMYLGVGLVIAFVAAVVDYRSWRDHPWLACAFFVVVLGLLCYVFNFKPVNGSYRWIEAGPLRLQPSEFAKLSIVILLSVWFDKLGWQVETFWKGAIAPAAMIAALCAPIIIEPDFGAFMVVAAAGGLVMFVAGVRLIYLFPMGMLGAAIGAFKVLTNANRRARLFDERALYQVKMALAAIHNGGIWGVGMGESMQKKLYLPESHTDFILAVGAEEFGIIYSIGVILAFLLFFALAVYIANKAADRFGRFLVIGMTFIIFFAAMFNIGVVCKALPTKGMALPFFSYGGTNMLSAFFAVGTILSVGIHSYRDRKRELIRKLIVN